jgi:uncharacterized RmlC-like cupin family protein
MKVVTFHIHPGDRNWSQLTVRLPGSRWIELYLAGGVERRAFVPSDGDQIAFRRDGAQDGGRFAGERLLPRRDRDDSRRPALRREGPARCDCRPHRTTRSDGIAMNREGQLVRDRMHSRGGFVTGSAVLPVSRLTLSTDASAPAHTRIAAHSHRDDRIATVISGTWHIGYGDRFDEAKLKALPPGSFYTEPPSQNHFA